MSNSTHKLIAAAAGIATPLAAYVLSDVFQDQVEERRKRHRPSNSADPIFLDAVTIANDLVPLIGGLPNLKGSELQIFGSDGRYLSKANGRKWKKGIEGWMKKGLRVKYVLLRFGEGVEEELRDLMRRESGKLLEVHVYDGQLANEDDELASVSRELRTCHPTLFFGHDKNNAMWLEGKHLENSEYAYNVYYISPKAMTDEWRKKFEMYKDKVDQILEHCRKI